MPESPYDLGVIVGLFRRPSENPYRQRSKEFNAWEAGYVRGQELSGLLRERRPPIRRDWSKRVWIRSRDDDGRCKVRLFFGL